MEPVMRRLSLIFVALLLSACGPLPDSEQLTGLRSGTWRAVAELPGGAMPFFIDLRKNAAGWSAEIVNGVERVAVPEIAVDGDELTLAFPAFNNHIELVLQEDGALVGALTLVKRYGELQVMPVRAEYGQQFRFSSSAAMSDGSVEGRWAVRFEDDEGVATVAVAELQQHGYEVTGTFLTPLGDYRYLAGDLQGDRLQLSTFDGAHAFLFSAVLTDDGDLLGDFWSGTQWHERWVAERDPQAMLPDADSLTRLAPGYEHISFSFPDQNGELVSLDDERFRGKVIVISLAGSWCPNCHDEAAFMAPLYLEYREQGVEMVALMYEHFEDFATAAEQVRLFRQEKGIEYTTLIAGVSDKTLAAETLPMLDHVLAFPTTIFIDRQGRVQRIHTGFSGPGTGEHYAAQSAGFRATLDQLVADQG
jgi:peroxiredoxin